MGQGDVGIDEGDGAVTELAVEGDGGGGHPSSSAAVFPAAAAVPATPAAPATPASHDELVVEVGARRWRVRHIPKVASPGSLRVNVMVGSGERFHVDTVDLYSAKQRARFHRGGRHRAAGRP